MSDIPEAIGEVTQGGLTARALEPAAGEGDGHTHETACLNCGTPLVGAHCHGCGQRGHVHKTLSAFFHDLLHAVLHFEGKVWRTLPMLAWRPGRLTREYIDGRRASYVSPIALFLFTIFLMFAVFSALGGGTALGEAVDVNPRIELEQASAATGKELAELRQRAAAATNDADDLADLERKIAAAEQQRDALQTALATMEADQGEGQFTTRIGEGSSPNSTAWGIGEGLRSAWDKAQENPQLLIYKMQTNAYKFAWLLVPISVPFVALTFAWRRRFGLYDHTIFTTYSITFMIALAFVASLASQFVSGTLGFLLLLYAPFHLYRQLRGTYALSRFSAFWRLLALSLFAWWAIAIFAVILTVMSG